VPLLRELCEGVGSLGATGHQRRLLPELKDSEGVRLVPMLRDVLLDQPVGLLDDHG
jgi:hypothetical protein